MRRVEQRATGQFLKVQGPAGIVVSIAGWMLDPEICAAMTIGPPRVDLAALIELRRLLMGISKPTHSRSDVGIVRGKNNAVSQVAGSGAGPADEPVICRQQAGWVGRLERNKIILTLAQILMQAAGIRVEELDDDKR